jgi:hypothetical protein
MWTTSWAKRGQGGGDVIEETIADAVVDLTADGSSFSAVDVEACIVASEHWQQLFGRAPGRAPAAAPGDAAVKSRVPAQPRSSSHPRQLQRRWRS